jgi:hypothetical protein
MWYVYEAINKLNVIKMSHHYSVLFCLTIFILTACGSGKLSSNKITKRYQDISLLAWNEDTVHSYQLALTKDNKFLFTIINNDTLKSEEYYHGIHSSQSSFDTIFLTYDRNNHPEGLTNYLIREASGGYLIQPFENGTKRIFLRIQRLGHRL